MTHLGLEAIRRILGGEGHSQEVEATAEHLVACDRCRTLAGSVIAELRAQSPRLRGEGQLQLIFDLIDQEHHWGMEALEALGEWAEVRRLPSRRSQRDRVRMTKACHTIAFFNLALSEFKEASSWDEGEFLAGLALLSIEAMSQRQLITQTSCNDLHGEVWTVIANARRRAAEWKRTHQALANAERFLKGGTGDRLLEAGLLSIVASTLADEGQVAQPLETLEKCKAIYEALSEGTLLARTLIQMANIWVENEPSKGLVALDHAAPLIPAEDSYLTLLAELLRVRCLIEVQKPVEALRIYQRCSRLFIIDPRIRLRIRGKFTGAQLMDALGNRQQAERLFDEVVDQDIEHELYKDAFLDLLYLYGHHVKSGDLEKAARVCRKAQTDSSLAAVAHDQMKAMWEQLLEAARQQAISPDLLRDLRQYLNVHWKHPAATAPVVLKRADQG